MSSPWAKIDKPEPLSLKDIMSEQLAGDLISREDKTIAEKLHAELNEKPVEENIFLDKAASVGDEVLLKSLDNYCESDEVIAHMLQQEFDRDYDDMLKRSEKRQNASSKINISFGNYRRTVKDFGSDSEEEVVALDPVEQRDWDRFDSVNRQFAALPPCGYQVQPDGTVLTKHDVTMSARRNACKLMNFPPEFETGDSAAFDLKLSNKVYNSLKAHSKAEQQRRVRINDKKLDRATAQSVMDPYTVELLYKVINNLQILLDVTGVIQIGKEAVVVHASGNPNCPTTTVPENCCVKIFKTTLSEYKQRDQYIKEDYRFKDRVGNQPSRKTVHLWAEKEMANLTRLKKADIPCPDVICLKKHLLIMNLIGNNEKTPAPRLKTSPRKIEDLIIAYDQVKEIMKDMYTKANLIHADLSEYNILWHQKQCYVIDVSQAVEPSQENAYYLLMRDCRNVTNFFQKKGVPLVDDPEDLFKEITGFDYTEAESYITIRETDKIKPHQVVGCQEKPSKFDTTWEKAKSGELPIPVNSFNEVKGPQLVDPPTA